MAALGGFILMFGFFAFNGGSQFTISGGGSRAVAVSIVNTMISGSAAGVTTIVLHRVIVSTSRNCVSDPPDLPSFRINTDSVTRINP